MAADLPAYTGPGGDCPKCGDFGALTEWHGIGGALGPDKMAGGREAPCKYIKKLCTFGGGGEHLCRMCGNCGYGWVEACNDSDGLLVEEAAGHFPGPPPAGAGSAAPQFDRVRPLDEG